MFLHIILSLFTFPFTNMALETLQGYNPIPNFNNISKPNCPTHCGNIQVPYPFGFGNDTGCSIDNSLHLTCNSSFETPKLFLGSNIIEIYNISDSEIRIVTGVSFKCYNQDGSKGDDFSWWIQLPSGFKFSRKNKLTVLGCDDNSEIIETSSRTSSAGCVGRCSNPQDVPDNGTCSGMGCCQTSIPRGLDYYKGTLDTFQNHTNVWPFNRCGYAFLGEDDSFVFRGASDLNDNSGNFVKGIEDNVPIVVDWVIAPEGGCSDQPTECKGNSSCYEVDGGGYRCRCNNGFEGNPYLDPGCQDTNECEDPRIVNACYGDCINTLGSYNCSCPGGSFGDANIDNGCQRQKNSKFSSTILIIAMMVGLLAIVCGIAGIIYGIRRRKLTKLREKFFEQNGGVLLKQKIKSQGSHEAIVLFTVAQLHKATNNYCRENIVGQGAYGEVYKGILPDKRVVAIKKSKIVDESQSEQFINELLILSQVLHRNVVKLLGCCLEEEVPVLVYEFISNNTLFHHIHSRLGGMSWLSWENRLRVAVEAASALAYLHSETIMPIIHRDVKSTNILLDDNYITKISDFGASRLVPLNHPQVSTLIKGTLGYLDPEYFSTSILTEKSDVYSFGVVLAELITGKKPIRADTSDDDKTLATYFANSVRENRLYEIVEPRILREGTLEHIQAVGDLVKRCLNAQGRDRPTMKEVVVELDSLRKFTTHHWMQRRTLQGPRSLVLEVEHSDLYEVPLVSDSNNDIDHT